MKFERTKGKAVDTRDAESYRKFLAGNKTFFTQAFWENGPRRPETTEAEIAPASAASGADATRN